MQVNPRHGESASALSNAAGPACAGHPFVSIILCTLGRRSSLQNCLDSLAAQDCSGFEILLVLNREGEAPPLRTPDDIPYRFLRELRPGVCVARNHAIPEARGDILVFVDDDIVAHPGWLHGLLAGFAYPQVACVTGRVIPKWVGTSSHPRTAVMYCGATSTAPRTFEPLAGWYEKALGGGIFGLGCNMAFSKQFLESHVRFPEDLGAGSLLGAADENYMFIQVLKHGFRTRYTPDAVVTHVSQDSAQEQESRAKEIYASAVALRLKLLTGEKGYRLATFKSFVSRCFRFAWASTQRSAADGSPRLLSSRGTLRAYLRGAWLYWKVSHRGKS